MKMANVLKRIDLRLDALELSDHAASKRAGKSDAIRNIRRAVARGKSRGVTMATLDGLADALETSRAYLLWETDDPSPVVANGGGDPPDGGDIERLKAQRDKLRAEADALDQAIAFLERARK